MLAVAYLWMAIVSRDLKAGVDLEMCGRDDAGLVPFSTTRWLLTSSIGHRLHGQEMLIGISNYNPDEETDCDFDSDVCNITWETQACNSAKYDYHSDYYPEVFEQLQHLRKVPLPNSPVLFPPVIVESTICDELSVVIPGEDDVTEADLDFGALDYEEDDVGGEMQEPEEDDDDQHGIRCICGKETWTDDLIQCICCAKYQHTSCLGAIDDPDTYGCEQCYPNLHKPLLKDLRPSIYPTILPYGLHSRNLGRSPASCYLSGPVQMALRLEEVQQELSGEPKLLITGRDPNEAARLDPTPGFTRLGSFYYCLQAINDQMQMDDGTLHSDFTNKLVNAAHELRGFWDHQFNDAAAFYEFVIQMLGMVGDRSDKKNLNEKGRTRWERFETRLFEQTTEYTAQLPLSQEVPAALEAYEKSGYDNDLVRAHTLHYVMEYQCRHCQEISRYYSQSLVSMLIPLELGKDGASFTLEDARERNFEYLLGHANCLACKETQRLSTEQEDEKWGRAACRVVNAPELLAFSISRAEHSGGTAAYATESRDLRFDAPSKDFDLKTWRTDEELPSVSHGQPFKIEDSTMYRRIGLLLFVPSRAHYVANVRAGPDNKGEWILFDDIQPQPYDLSPIDIDTMLQPSDYPDFDGKLHDKVRKDLAGYTEGLILYRKQPLPAGRLSPSQDDVGVLGQSGIMSAPDDAGFQIEEDPLPGPDSASEDEVMRDTIEAQKAFALSPVAPTASSLTGVSEFNLAWEQDRALEAPPTARPAATEAEDAAVAALLSLSMPPPMV